MLGFDVRAARIAWTVSLVAMALYATFSIRRTLFVFVLAIFFSYMVYPMVRTLNRFTPKRLSHSMSTAIVFAVLLLVLVGLIALVGPPIADQATKLADRLPELTRDTHFIDRINLPEWLMPFRSRISQFVSEHLQTGTAVAVPLAQQVGRTLLLVASNLIYVVLIPILAFLFIVGGADMRDRFLAWTGKRRYAPFWTGMVEDLDQLLGKYMRALLILAMATIVVYGVVFTVSGLPYGLLLAVVAGVLEFIPVLGPLAAAVACVLVAGLSGYSHVLFIVGFIAAYRVFQDYVLNPKLMSEGVKIPPLLVLFGLLAGEEIGGVVGIFLSVPVLATAKILILRIAQANRRSKVASASAATGLPLAVAPAVGDATLIAEPVVGDAVVPDTVSQATPAAHAAATSGVAAGPGGTPPALAT
ncbi:MAG: family transporter [Rhizobacter sp.]|nr:family transporter [Rhizobacter sp.]